MLQSFRHDQSIDPTGRVSSVQRLSLPLPIDADEKAARAAGRLYWQFLRQFGAPVLRVTEAPDGAVSVGLPGLLLLAFKPPLLLPEGAGLLLRYPIDRGAAVHPGFAGAGYLQMGLQPGEVSLAVAGYVPNLIRLHTRIYEWTQSAIHLRVARGYLPLLVARMTGEANPFDRS